jgi:hypothetical protein
MNVEFILFSRMCVAVDGVWIDEQMYWPLTNDYDTIGISTLYSSQEHIV